MKEDKIWRTKGVTVLEEKSKKGKTLIHPTEIIELQGQSIWAIKISYQQRKRLKTKEKKQT